MKTVLYGPSFNSKAVDAFDPLELDDLSRFEGEGGSQAPERAAGRVDVPFEHGRWRRHHPAAVETKSGKSANKKDENE
jgi:hypothetical protein